MDGGKRRTKNDSLSGAFRRSEFWRNVTLASIGLLIASLAALGAGVGPPLQRWIGPLAVILSVAFGISFVIAAITSIEFRRASAAARRANHREARRKLTRREVIVYLAAAVSSVVVGVAYITSLHAEPWVWPAFVTASLLIVGVFWIRQRP